MPENKIDISIDKPYRCSDIINHIMTYDDIIKHFGTQVEAAKWLGLGQSTIAGWKRDGIPELRQLWLEKKMPRRKPRKRQPQHQGRQGV
jgi:hypothetical protein